MFKLYIFDEVNQDYKKQISNINNQVKKYKDDLQNYKDKLSNNSRTVTSDGIIQNLTIANEWDAIADYQVIGNNVKQTSSVVKPGEKAGGHGIYIPEDKQLVRTTFVSDSPKEFTVIATYTGLKNSNYNGKKISTLVAKYTISPNTTSRINGISIYSDPTNGFEELRGIVKGSYEFYYEDGSPVNFEKGTAYLALGSLNNYQNGQDHYEYVKVISGGQAYELIGSSVTIHNENELYSTYPNTMRAENYYRDGIERYNPDPSIPLSPNFNKYPRWDIGWLSPYAFYGAGLVSLEGSKYTFEVGVGGEKHFTTDELRNELPANGLWYNMATVIPKTYAPVPPQISYHLDSSKKGY